jgi:hypothetical protein
MPWHMSHLISNSYMALFPMRCVLRGFCVCDVL